MSHLLSPEPNLTLHNLISALEVVDENWDIMAWYMNLSVSRRLHIRKQFHHKIFKKESLKEFLKSHPAPSWWVVADALYKLGRIVDYPANNTALERVMSMYPTGEYVASQCTHYTLYCHEQSHIISHSQGLTNGLSDRDYRLECSLFPFFSTKMNR